MNELDRHDTIRAVAYADGVLRLLDQRRLPFAEEVLECRSADDVARAIRDLAVRGPYKTTGISMTASRQKVFSCRPTSKTDERSCAKS